MSAIPACASPQPIDQLFKATSFEGDPTAIITYQNDSVRFLAVKRLGLNICDDIVTTVPFSPAKRPESRAVRFYGLTLSDPTAGSRVRLVSLGLRSIEFPGSEKKEAACIREIITFGASVVAFDPNSVDERRFIATGTSFMRGDDLVYPCICFREGKRSIASVRSSGYIMLPTDTIVVVGVL